jgi:transposase-like protein
LSPVVILSPYFLEGGEMVWKARSAMSLKEEFVLFAGQEGANLSALCRRFGIDRKSVALKAVVLKLRGAGEDIPSTP